jgi:urea transporter
MSGLFILVGLFIQSTRVALHGVVGLVCGNLIAIMLGFDKGRVRSGMFGYNSLLVGLAFATFDSTEKHRDYNGYTLLASVVFSSFPSFFFVMTGKLLVLYNSLPLTMPFNVATIDFLLAPTNMGRAETNSVRVPALPPIITQPGSQGCPRRSSLLKRFEVSAKSILQMISSLGALFWLASLYTRELRQPQLSSVLLWAPP